MKLHLSCETKVRGLEVAEVATAAKMDISVGRDPFLGASIYGLKE